MFYTQVYHKKNPPKMPLNWMSLSSELSPILCSDGEKWLNSKQDFFYSAPLQHQAKVVVAVTTVRTVSSLPSALKRPWLSHTGAKMCSARL